MKNALTLLFLLIFINPVFSQDEPNNSSTKNYNQVELGKRYLKLGFSWIGSRNYEKAENYLSEGMNTIKLSGNKYWEAVGYEFYGYFYLAKNNKTLALEYFTQAQTLYERYGKLSNGEGSNEALSSLIESLKNNEVVLFGSGGNSSNNSEKYNTLLTKYNEVVQERDDLKSVLTGLKREIAEMRKMNKELQTKVDACLAANEPKAIKGFEPAEIPLTSSISTQNPTIGHSPWENTTPDEPEFNGSSKKWMVLQAGGGNIFNLEEKLKFGVIEVGGFLTLSSTYSIYGGIISVEVYKGYNWDAPFDLCVGNSTSGVGPFIDGYAGIRYYFLNNYGVYAKGGYNMAYVMDLVPVSYFNFSVGAIFRL